MMAIVSVRLYASARELAGTAEDQVEAENLGDLLRKLSDRYGPHFSKLVSRGAGDEGMVILLNGRNVNPRLSNLSLNQNDEICIFPPVSGG